MDGKSIDGCNLFFTNAYKELLSQVYKNMKIVQINHFSYKAAGNIMMNLHNALMANGMDSYVVWGRGRKGENDHEYYMNDNLGVIWHVLYGRIFDRAGFASVRATKKLVRWLKGVNPDIIHLHCIHGYYINLKILFNYIRENHIKVIWTQHDCWAFTGHCAYFDMVRCEKWKNGCFNCKQSDSYPKAYTDDSNNNWYQKKALFSGVDMHIVTPCYWLKKIINDSFLREYPITVIYNGVDLNAFHPTKNKFRKKNHLENKFLILGVASEWTKRKGLYDFFKLNQELDGFKYQIIIVGLSKNQVKNIPQNIIVVQRTNNIQELVDIYSSADVFFNPTYEDNFPTTNIEALACGTPIITYNTGGAPECLTNKDCGFVVEQGNIAAVLNIIIRNDWKQMYMSFAKELFSVDAMTNAYKELYIEKNN